MAWNGNKGRAMPQSDAIRDIRQYLYQMTLGATPGSVDTSTLETLLTNIETYSLRDNWNVVAGNIATLTYYGGVAAGHPASSTTEVHTAVYSNGSGTVFTNTFTYDAANNILTITTS